VFDGGLFVVSLWWDDGGSWCDSNDNSNNNCNRNSNRNDNRRFLRCAAE